MNPVRVVLHDDVDVAVVPYTTLLSVPHSMDRQDATSKGGIHPRRMSGDIIS